MDRIRIFQSTRPVENGSNSSDMKKNSSSTREDLFLLLKTTRILKELMLSHGRDQEVKTRDGKSSTLIKKLTSRTRDSMIDSDSTSTDHST
jgi:hypothetical protein